MPFWKSRADAEQAGDTLYTPTFREAIKGFLAAHGSAHQHGIVEYMTEMYGASGSGVRGTLQRMVADGEISQDGRSYQVPDEDVAPDGLSDWG